MQHPKSLAKTILQTGSNSQPPLKVLRNAKSIEYWNKYIKLHTKVVSNFFGMEPSHYYNEIAYTRWPYYISISLFLTIFYFLVSFSKLSYTMYLAGIGFLLTLYYAMNWFKDMVIESTYLGKYNRKVRTTLVYGCVLFAISEIFIFGSFFYVYFDRIFHPSIFAGNNSLPFGVEPMYKSLTPFLATFYLYVSGIFCNFTYVLIRLGSWWYSVLCTFAALLLGLLFLKTQLSEYTHLLFNITESVYASCFYILTGFHGLHVIVGLLFLFFQFERLYNCHFNSMHFTGFTLAIMYWHFVDIIWIFLYISIYLFNWTSTYYYLWDHKI